MAVPSTSRVAATSINVQIHSVTAVLTMRLPSRTLFETACRIDLEGIVAKRKDSLYRAPEKPSPHWIKIKNADYSRADGRQECFERLP